MKEMPIFVKNNWSTYNYKNGDKDKNFIIEDLGYSNHPNIILGDEINFVAIFQHPNHLVNSYLFRIEIEGFSEIFEVLDLPGFFEMHAKCSKLIQDHFDTLISIEALKND